MPDYLDVVYDKKIRPQTRYPFQLCEHLFLRFDMKKSNKLLDVGCGRGDFSKGFKELGLLVSGLDVIKSQSEMLKDIEIKYANIENDKFPFNDETFDIIFSKSVIEHLRNPDNFIKEIHRLLKPGGRIIILTPDWQSQRLIFYDDYTHCHPYTPISLRDLLKIHGFKEVSSEIFYQLPVLWKYPWLKIFSKFLQIFGPVKKIHKNKFIRWSKELMILASGKK